MLKYLRNMFGKKQMEKYADRTIQLEKDELEFFSVLLARYSQMIQPEVDENELADLIIDYLRYKGITVASMHRLAEIVQATRFKPGEDTWQ